MATGNENSGLKAAVAIFGALTLLLAVACYFLYSAYDQASAQAAKAKTEQAAAEKARGDANRDYKQLRDIVGIPDKFESFDAVKKEVERRRGELVNLVNTGGAEVEKAISAADAEAKAAGLNNLPAEIEKLRSEGAALRTQYKTDSDMSNQLDRLVKMLVNTSSLLAQFSRDNVGLRRTLVSIDGINKEQVKTIADARDQKGNDLTKTQAENDDTQRTLRADNSKMQQEIGSLNQQVDAAKTDLENKTKEFEKTLADQRSIVQDLRIKLAKKENVLDEPDGYVTRVNLARKEIRANITRSMGVREQMIMTIFDKGSPGLPTDKPKGTIMVTVVGDTESTATIMTTKNFRNPIREGDIIYSASWSPNEPKRFALIGKIDINRDGEDDRQDVRRMIENSGGIVDYDLPPPGVGVEMGKLNARITWFVQDDKGSFRNTGNEMTGKTEEERNFMTKEKRIIDDAYKQGIQPKPLSRLAAELGVSGVDRGNVDYGSVEAKNTSLINSILNPKGTKPAAKPADDPAGAAPAGDAGAAPDANNN